MSAYVVPPSCVLPNVSRLSRRVWRLLGANPSPMTLGGTNCYLIGNSTARILLDTGEGKTEFPAILADALDQARAHDNLPAPVTISDVVCSHWHPDHVGGIPQVLSMFPDARLRIAESAVVPRAGTPFDKFPPLRDGEAITTPDGDTTLRVLLTRGHSDDHCCFLLREAEEEQQMGGGGRVSVFTGDCVLGFGSSVFASLPEFMRSLETLRALRPSAVYPAHGPTVFDDAPGYIDRYIAHREQREVQVLAAVRQLTSTTATSTTASSSSTTTNLPTIVTAVYGTELSEKLLIGATGNALHCLKKLVADGKVEVDFPECANREEAASLASIMETEFDYKNDVYLARMANSSCSCSKESQQLLLSRVKDFKWRAVAAASAGAAGEGAAAE